MNEHMVTLLMEIVDKLGRIDDTLASMANSRKEDTDEIVATLESIEGTLASFKSEPIKIKKVD